MNGDFAHNVLKRPDSVIEHDADFAITLVGTNDVMAVFNPKVGKAWRSAKKLPCAQTKVWYQENVEAIIRRLQGSSKAGIAVCSLPNLGEDLDSPASLLVREHNAVIAEVASSLGVSYLPVNERHTDFLREHLPSHGRAMNSEMLSPMTWKLLLYHWVLRMSFDAIAKRNGFS